MKHGSTAQRAMGDARREDATPNLEFEGRLARASIELSRTDEALASARGDFGRVARGSPLGVIRVRDEEQLCTAIAAANSCGVQLTLRNGGNSQSGQSLAAQSYCVSLAELERSVEVHAENATATCSASASWRDVVAAAARHGLVPKVVPLNLDLSIGGTLSAGGFGASSHQYGSAASTVQSLRLVSGAGQRVTCSREANPGAFDAVLGGLGRAGAMTSATVSLRRAQRRVSSVFALYTNLRDCLRDMRLLRARGCSYVEGFCSASFQGLRKTAAGRQPLLRWLYSLHFSFEYDEDDADSKSLTDELHCLEVVHRETDDHLSFLDRYQVRFETMRRSGAWNQAHPWFECLLPADAAAEFIEELLPLLPGALGDGHRIFEINGAANPKFLQLPVDASGMSLAFAILPVGVPEGSLAATLEFIQRATDLLYRHGGRRYLSGWLGDCDEAFWRRHHDSRHDEWVAAKRALDPNGILTSRLFSG